MTGDAREAILALLASRSSSATVCPSEVARAVAVGSEWRAAMPAVHSAVDRLIEEGAIRLSWKGRGLPSREGPYRIGMVQGLSTPPCNDQERRGTPDHVRGDERKSELGSV